jgi:hypothetical protein
MVSVQRRFNSTGRIRITRDRVNIALEQPADMISFPSAVATINLNELDLPADASVSIEAYYRSSFMRFACGTVARLSIPERMDLTDIDRGGATLFRVLIIASDKSGQILASAEGLRPAKKGDGRDRQPLLPIRETDLGAELWNIAIDARTGPTLLINNRVPGLAVRIRSWPLLQGAILPHAFRVILQNLSAAGEEEGDGLWGEDWRRFLEELGVATEPDDPDDLDLRDEWIETAVKAFCDLKDFAARVQLGPLVPESPHV